MALGLWVGRNIYKQMHGFTLKTPNSQLYEYKIGIYDFTAELVKNDILAKSQPHMVQDCGVIPNSTI